MPSFSPADNARRMGVTVAEVVCVIGTLIGVGVIGGPEVQQAAGGALAADATYIAPAGPAFSIWSVIYLGLAAYTLWQWLPSQNNARQRAIGWLAGGSMILNAAWLIVVRNGWLWVSVIVIVALVLTLGLLMRRLTEIPPTTRAERIIVDGTFGLYLGWVSVAVCANIAATLVASGLDPARPAVDIITILVLAAVVGLAVLYRRRIGPRIAVAAALSWGLSWIAVGRLAEAPRSLPVGIAAAIAAITVAGIAAAGVLSQRPQVRVQPPSSPLPRR